MCPLTPPTSWTGCPASGPLHVTPFQPGPVLAEAPGLLCSPGPHMQFSEPWTSFPAVTPQVWGLSLAAFLGCCLIDYLGSLFSGDVNLAGSRDGCVFNLSPWSRLRRLPLSLGQEEMEGPGSLGQALEPVDFQKQTLGSPQPHQPASLQTGPVNY